MLVGRVDDHRLAGPLVAHDEDVVLERPDDDLVDPDVGGLVVGRAGAGRAWATTLLRPRDRSAGGSGRGRDGNWTGRSSTVEPGPMDFRDTPAEAAFRDEVRTWLAEHLVGEFAALGGRRRPGRRDRLRGPHRVGARCSAATAGSACRGPRSTAAAAPASSSRSSSTRSTPRPARRPASASSARACSRPTLHRVRHRGAEAALPPEDPVGRGAVVPGLLGAERRLRPLERADPRACSTATSGSSTARRCGRRSRTAPQWCFCVCRTDPDAPAHKGLSYLLVPMDQPGVDGPAAQADDRHRGVQRGLLRRRPHRPVDTCSAR